MARIFLSYAREDSSTARDLARALEARGHSVWWDQHISGGRRFAAEIEKALQESEAVVVLWSAAARASPWVADEAAAGRDTGRLVPVTLDGEPPPLGFRQFQTIACLGGGRGEIKRVSGTITQAIGSLQAFAGPDGEPGQAFKGPREKRFRESVNWRWMIAGLAALSLALGLTYYLRPGGESAVPSVMVVQSPSGNPQLAAEVARNLTTDLQRLQEARSERFSLLAPGPAGAADMDVDVSASSSGKLLQVNASLKSKPEILWSGAFEVPYEQRNEIRQQVAAKVGAVLNCALDARTPEGKRADTLTLKLYLRACDAVNFDRSKDAPQRVVAALEQVVRRNPRLPAAWSLLAHAQLFAGSGESAVRQSIRKARALDPDNALTFVTEVTMLPPGSWLEALKIADQGVKVAPNDPALHSTRAFVLADLGRVKEAINEAQLSVQLDPISQDGRLTYIELLAVGGQLRDAIAELAAAERMWPGALAVQQTRFRVAMRYGDAKEALRILDSAAAAQLEAFSPFLQAENANRAFLNARLDPSLANVDGAIDAYRRMPTDDSAARTIQVLQTLVAFGRIDDAVALLKQPDLARQSRSGSSYLFRATMSRLWKEPDFFRFTSRVGLVNSWRSSRRWPDFCSDPKLPYDCRREAEKYRT